MPQLLSFVLLNERAHVLQTTEPLHPGAHAPQLGREKKTRMPQLGRSPRATTREKPTRHNKRSLMPQLRPDTAKNKIKKINKYFLKKERKSVPANVPVKTGLDSWEPIV